MRKTFTLMALSMAVAASAQWTKPAYPTAQPLTLDTECYMLNTDADGFLMGGNDWGTRASYSSTYGDVVKIQQFASDEVAWDGESYFIMNSVVNGWSAGNWCALYIDSGGSTWVDATASVTASDQGFTFVSLGDNKYKVGFSAQNLNWNQETCYGAYLGGDTSQGDTRLWICQPGDYDEYYQLTWIFVTPDDYTAYVAEELRYEAAVALGEALTAALANENNQGIDLSEVQAVYNDNTSTTEQLTAATERVTELVIAFQTAKATVDNPADYTPMITNPAYDDGDNDGWSGSSPSVSYGVAELYSWSASTFDYYQTISGLPAGIFRIGVTGYYRSGTNAADYEHFISEDADSYRHTRLYATVEGNTVSTPLPLQSAGASATALGGSTYQSALGFVPNSMEAANIYFQAGQYDPTTILVASPEDGTITIGLSKTESQTDNWAIWDNWTLEYLGSSAEAYTLLANQVLGTYTDYETNEPMFYQKSIYEAYLTAKAAVYDASTAEGIGAAIGEFEVAVAALEASVAAYDAYNTQLQAAQDWYYTTTSGAEEVEALGEYLDNGVEEYLTEGTMTTEEIEAETATLAQLLYNAKANSMADGDDCTDMIVNADFSAEGGWTSAVGPTWPTDNCQVGEAINMVFDVYQEFTGMQNGLYEFTTYDIYRPANDGSYTGQEDYKAYIYVNGFQKLMNHILDGASAEQVHSDDYQSSKGYVPTSAAGAAAHFAAGSYKQTVYGLVTDGTLRLGYLNNLRYADGSRAWWGPATLIFRAKNADALAEATALTLPEAQDLLSSYCGKPELTTLTQAIEDCSYAEDSDEAYSALVALKLAMDAVEECALTYASLSIAYDALAEAAAGVTDDEVTAALATAEATLADQDMDNAAAAELVETLNALTVSLKLGDTVASLDNPQDVSSFIINNNFDPNDGDKDSQYIKGWTTSAMNGYKGYSASYNRAAIDLYQDLSGLPAGTYKAICHGFYRAGYWYEEENYIAIGTETHLSTVYAQTTDDTYSTLMLNLTEGATATLPDGWSTGWGDGNELKYYTLTSGLYAPDNQLGGGYYCAKGYYANEVPFYVGEDGKVRIGVTKTEIIANDYSVIGLWELYYYGEENNVAALNGEETDGVTSTAAATPLAWYTLSGTRVASPQRGVAIVKMSDGSVRKMIVQ